MSVSKRSRGGFRPFTPRVSSPSEPLPSLDLSKDPTRLDYFPGVEEVSGLRQRRVQRVTEVMQRTLGKNLVNDGFAWVIKSCAPVSAEFVNFANIPVPDGLTVDAFRVEGLYQIPWMWITLDNDLLVLNIYVDGVLVFSMDGVTMNASGLGLWVYSPIFLVAYALGGSYTVAIRLETFYAKSLGAAVFNPDIVPHVITLVQGAVMNYEVA